MSKYNHAIEVALTDEQQQMARNLNPGWSARHVYVPVMVGLIVLDHQDNPRWEPQTDEVAGLINEVIETVIDRSDPNGTVLVDTELPVGEVECHPFPDTLIIIPKGAS